MGQRTKWALLKRKNTNDQETHWRISTFLVIREIQVKTTLKFHLTSIKLANFRNTNNNNTGEVKGKTVHSNIVDGDFKLIKSFWKAVWRLLRSWEWNHPALPLLTLCSKDLNQHTTKIQPHRFLNTAIHKTEIWNSPNCTSVDEQMKKR